MAEQTRGGGVPRCVLTRSWSSSTPTPTSVRSSPRSSSTSPSITKAGGTVNSLDVWGRRRLAYEIRKKSEGIYVVLTLSAQPDDVKELDRQFTLNESIMRTKVIRTDAH